MKAERETEFTLPTRMARRRLLAGRLVLGVVCANALFALLAAWLLSGPMAEMTRFEFGFLAWAGILWPASLILTVPVMAPVLIKVLRPAPARYESEGSDKAAGETE